MSRYISDSHVCEIHDMADSAKVKSRKKKKEKAAATEKPPAKPVDGDGKPADVEDKSEITPPTDKTAADQVLTDASEVKKRERKKSRRLRRKLEQQIATGANALGDIPRLARPHMAIHATATPTTPKDPNSIVSI